MSVKLALLPDMHSEQPKIETRQVFQLSLMEYWDGGLAAQNFRAGFIGVFVLVLTLPAMLC